MRRMNLKMKVAGGALALAAAWALGYGAGHSASAGGTTSVSSAGGTTSVSSTDATERVPPAAHATRAEGDSPTQPKAERVPPAAPDSFRVVDVDYDGQNKLDVWLSERPEMEDARRYIEITPLRRGQPAVSFDWRWNDKRHHCMPKLVVAGDFPFDTNVTLRIKKGFAQRGCAACTNAWEVLADDFTYTFRRQDYTPYVTFRDNGRYLPPCGDRTIALESVNTSAFTGTLYRVENANIVQLLAREEDLYSGYWHGGSADLGDTSELASEPTNVVVTFSACRNEKAFAHMPVVPADGGPSNGVFLVAFHNECRLVCVSDLGLSVRENGGEPMVWVTSFTTGKPVPNAAVELRTSANVVAYRGRTDAHGLCHPKRVARGKTFAVIVTAPDGRDRTFMALSRRNAIDETYADGDRDEYLKPADCTGFLWTERGIYRHDEKIFCHLILRNGAMKAPKPFPVTLQLVKPNGQDVFASKTVVSDANGALAYAGFGVPADQPSGTWRIVARMPGKDGRVLDSRDVKIEEFAPPQIRVNVAADKSAPLAGFAFDISAEHLFGAPADALACEGAVCFEDAPFAPAQWKGYVFGDPKRGLKPNFHRLGSRTLDAQGRVRFAAPIWKDDGLPSAAVRATTQGIVFEDGGRPVTARDVTICHYYPYYLGSSLGNSVKLPAQGTPFTLPLACVLPDGARVPTPKKLTAKLERIDTVYTYKIGSHGWADWDTQRIPSTVVENIAVTTLTNADTLVELPVTIEGDYIVTVQDAEADVSYSHAFYAGAYEEEDVKASLENPTTVTLQPDKAFYRVGEKPRIVIKSPFAGSALLTVMRDSERYTRVLALTNATSVIVLYPITREDAPNLDVAISIVQSVGENAKHLATRAHGQTTLRVRPQEHEIDVVVEALLSRAEGRAPQMAVSVDASNANAVVVTLVDEGINLLTGEQTPDPVAAFAVVRKATHPLWDLYDRLLPVDGAALRRSGVKTGGDCGAALLGRVSPQPTRRFKPLALWRVAEKNAAGRWYATFDLPPFVGEVRVTAVAYSADATGATSVQRKVAPKIVMQPDAPRFVAPKDRFFVTLPLHNRSGDAADVSYEVLANGARIAACDRLALKKDAATNIWTEVVAPDGPGEMKLVYRVSGAGERHEETILLPVRPAVAWKTSAGVCAAGETNALKRDLGPYDRLAVRTFDSPLGNYEAALRWLAEYRHGCLEQTCSRIFPIIAAGGVLNGIVSNRADVVGGGVRRVESMVRQNGFTMWPDTDYAPWDEEVTLYAAHFLIAAEKAGAALNANVRQRVLDVFVTRLSHDRNAALASYAAFVKALAGEPDRDNLNALYDHRAEFTALTRARLALAFATIGDRKRAVALLADAYEPQDVREAAFQLMARVALDPKDPHALPLVAWLDAKRDRTRFCWGTTGENAHALMAIGAYYQANPPKRGETFAAWQRLSLPDPESVADEQHGLFLSRRLLTADGTPANLAKVPCGALLYAEIAITSAVTRVCNDLVVEDLFAGAYEPVRTDICRLPEEVMPTNRVVDWVMRTDARDDRLLVFSKRFTLEVGHVAYMVYPVRAVSAGAFVLPGASVEGMYNPDLFARRAPARIVVVH